LTDIPHKIAISFMPSQAREIRRIAHEKGWSVSAVVRGLVSDGLRALRVKGAADELAERMLFKLPEGCAAVAMQADGTMRFITKEQMYVLPQHRGEGGLDQSD
jgi:hypothetical protein